MNIHLIVTKEYIQKAKLLINEVLNTEQHHFIVDAMNLKSDDIIHLIGNNAAHITLQRFERPELKHENLDYKNTIIYGDFIYRRLEIIASKYNSPIFCMSMGYEIVDSLKNIEDVFVDSDIGIGYTDGVPIVDNIVFMPNENTQRLLKYFNNMRNKKLNTSLLDAISFMGEDIKVLDISSGLDECMLEEHTPSSSLIQPVIWSNNTRSLIFLEEETEKGI